MSNLSKTTKLLSIRSKRHTEDSPKSSTLFTTEVKTLTLIEEPMQCSKEKRMSLVLYKLASFTFQYLKDINKDEQISISLKTYFVLRKRHISCNSHMRMHCG